MDMNLGNEFTDVRLTDDVVNSQKDNEKDNDSVDEEVIRVLKEALNKENLVERIDLSGRQLKFLPEPFGKIRALVVLDLSQNNLEVIPDSVSGLQKLEEFNVASNLLETLPDSIGLLINLKVLDVSGNKLKKLPESIAGCRSLIELDASFNNLMFLPTNIGYGLVNLQKLSIPFNNNFNDLTEVPETVGDLRNLKELDLSTNQIRALPESIYQLQNLTKLHVDQNPLVIPPLDIVNKGLQAIMEYMTKRRLDMLEAEQQRIILEKNAETDTGWVAWGTSTLSNAYTGVSQTVSGYLGGNAPRDPYLDQQL
ncbi:uncharacterized protein [Henckelia pumila]|uniref:uncharacterized protein isoform X2 n=1 Tax=Henckelia pumila TaxID=405737 RepID=UPI003C6E5171